MTTHSKTSIPEGIWGAVLLNVNHHGCIDWRALEEQVHILCKSPLNGIYTNGTAGEFHNQTEAEFEQLTELVAQIASEHNKPFQIGVSHSNPRIARNRLDVVTRLQPTAVQFTLPDWWCLSDTELETFATGMQTAAECTALVLYNPPHAKHQVPLSKIHALKAIMPNLVGVKILGGDKSWYASNTDTLNALSVFVPGHTVAFGRPQGARGSYSNVACLSPAGAVQHWNLIETDVEAAVELEQRINHFMQRHVVSLAKRKGLSNTALDKLMAAAGGWCPMSAQLLWPYHSASDQDVYSVAKAARAELPELFAND